MLAISTLWKVRGLNCFFAASQKPNVTLAKPIADRLALGTFSQMAKASICSNTLSPMRSTSR
ncbi:hypothetical protein D9M72_240900 [compost metagenome]